MLLPFLPFTASAQQNQDDYRTGIGVRLGNTPGITAKKFFGDQGAVEGLLHIFREAEYDGFLVTGLYEWHVRAFQAERFNWYFGAGFHAGAYQRRDNNSPQNPVADTDNNGTLYGADAIIGLEYSLLTVPLAFSIDFKPALTVPSNKLTPFNGAISARWLFR